MVRHNSETIIVSQVIQVHHVVESYGANPALGFTRRKLRECFARGDPAWECSSQVQCRAQVTLFLSSFDGTFGLFLLLPAVNNADKNTLQSGALTQHDRVLDEEGARC